MKKETVFLTATLFLVLVGFVFLEIKDKESSEIDNGESVPLNLTSLDFSSEERDEEGQQCGEEDIIEYFYYESVPEKDRKSNKFGLYVYAENKDFIRLADELVNSNGGDWGFVLIPYNVDDQDFTKWREVFDLLYKEHLIPIVQLYDVDDNGYKEEIKNAAEFLNSFVWPVRQRYISVYNEPNDSKFWYGRVDPAEYVKVLDYAVDTFKKENPDFFMINGALNASAARQNGYMDSFEFMLAMNNEIPGIFEKLDGWASHAYPQPNFSGSPYDSGRWSIRAYESELSFLKNTLEVDKILPVFITETGWAHSEGVSENSAYFSSKVVAQNFEYAYESVWLKDDNVIAVTPFTIWYEPPFDHFAWVNEDKVPYTHFDAVKSIKKVAGTPEKLAKGTLKLKECNE